MTRFGFEDRRMGDHNFAAEFDENLKKRNALRFSQQEAVKARNAASRLASRSRTTVARRHGRRAHAEGGPFPATN